MQISSGHMLRGSCAACPGKGRPPSARLVTSVLASSTNQTPSSAEAAPCAQRTASLEQRWGEGTATPTNTGGKVSNLGIRINSNFDSGNCEVVDIAGYDDIQLRIHEDPHCESDGRSHYQWFMYRVTGAKRQQLTMKLMNAGSSSYPTAWAGYNACASYDHKHWFRVPSEYDSSSGVFSIKHKPERDAVVYAYFCPYTYVRHQDLIAEMQSHDCVELEVLGETLDGHDLDMLRIGTGSKNVFVIGRQHPGETMAEYFIEGMLRRLVDPHDPIAKKAREEAVFWVVPNMNPDGSWRGCLRCSSSGANLNREWQNPSLSKSPEVYFVRSRMDAVGVDMLLDVHGDEELPYVFVNGNEGNPNWSERLEGLESAFSQALALASPDFQTEHGYEKDGCPNQTVCAHAVGVQYDCLALTLEMPFKDNANLPDEHQGWSAERSMLLGRDALGPIVQMLPMLR